MRKKVKTGVCKAAQLRDGSRHPFGMLGGVTALGGGELEVYRQIRNAVPILDAAIGKLVRLTGGFTVSCGNRKAEWELDRFLKTVNTGARELSGRVFAEHAGLWQGCGRDGGRRERDHGGFVGRCDEALCAGGNVGNGVCVRAVAGRGGEDLSEAESDFVRGMEPG